MHYVFWPVALPPTDPLLRVPLVAGCFDFNEDCPFWAVAGECRRNERSIPVSLTASA